MKSIKGNWIMETKANDIIINLINRNKKDIEQIGKFIKKLDRFGSKELAGKIQNLMIEEVLRLGNQNNELKEIINYAKTTGDIEKFRRNALENATRKE